MSFGRFVEFGPVRTPHDGLCDLPSQRPSGFPVQRGDRWECECGIQHLYVLKVGENNEELGMTWVRA